MHREAKGTGLKSHSRRESRLCGLSPCVNHYTRLDLQLQNQDLQSP